jgi:hypothetical protein
MATMTFAVYQNVVLRETLATSPSSMAEGLERQLFNVSPQGGAVVSHRANPEGHPDPR